jgi:dihydrofolate synthase/folylpolyglutamate synthase
VNYPDSVQFLYALGNEAKTAKFGLERIRAMLEALGRPQDRLRIVHVAGTNGKGSTCAMVESALRAAGKRTGLFTSPHLHRPEERIQVEGSAVDAAEFTEAFNRVHAEAERLLQAGAIDYHTTYFETLTAMALLVFAAQGVEWVVLETGLGGRLDATNAVEQPRITVITQIDFDHESYLGRSLESIAGEKAGILKPGVPAVFAQQRPAAAAVLEARAAELGVPVTRPAEWSVNNLEYHARGSQFELEIPAGAGHLQIECPLPGEHQVENAKVAAATLLELGIPHAAIESGIRQAKWPGRIELLAENPDVIADGAHNPAGARALASYVGRFYGGKRVCLILGAMRDKAVAEIAGILCPGAETVIATAPRQDRALAPEALAKVVDHPRVEIAPGIREALAQARARSCDAIFITGSLFLVAEARAIFAASQGSALL